MIKFSLLVTILIALSSAVFSQTATPAKKGTVSGGSDAPKSSAAFAEVLLKRTEIEADLESMLVEYTEDYPKVKQERFELDLIIKESERLLVVRAGDAAKLSAALGKLMVRKVELQGELWSLQQQFGDGHPDVKRAKRKVEIFERAIKEILG